MHVYYLLVNMFILVLSSHSFSVHFLQWSFESRDLEEKEQERRGWLRRDASGASEAVWRSGEEIRRPSECD